MKSPVIEIREELETLPKEVIIRITNQGESILSLDNEQIEREEITIR